MLFAAERPLPGNRAAVGLAGFGFLVERFGLLLPVVMGTGPALAIGAVFISLGVAIGVLSLDVRCADRAQNMCSPSLFEAV